MDASIRFEPQLGLRKNVLRLDAVFLGMAGGIQLVLELLGHFAGKGLYHDFLYHSPYTIGFFEAHGLAILVAILFLRVAVADPRRHWHQFGLGVHVLLGVANLIFWQSFQVVGMVPAGVVATLLHFAFIAAHLFCLNTNQAEIV